MAYTVKKLARLSGVSVRTLHWYDEIGLLKPSTIGPHSYRYYEEQQLLHLQQILFFKELGFALKDIQKLLAQDDFDTLSSLKAHRKILEDEIIRKKNLIVTIDRTIQYLRGKQSMKNEELYYGFEGDRQKDYEQYLMKYHGEAVKDLLSESKKRTAQWDKKEWERVKNEGHEIYKALADALEQELEPYCEEVEAIIGKHYQMIQKFYDVSKEVYIGLTQLYAEHPDFIKFFEAYHPKLVEFMGKSMRHYAHKNLGKPFEYQERI